ncbi:C25 family cysteine peptidase [Marinoscillum sp. MHG1-6]|uniref:putative type IX secretion system sortase PorU2 n=1 Tax=Marinoscillum sp. MHG1-6 TaxID=2959627 RepID=UPI00215836DC|nr:C25 family cysteine peptidase [Marinoscillum sp. MHG1-6]
MTLKNRLQLTVALMLSCIVSMAQYANDWIDYNQRYFEIPVSEDGLYTITQSQMIAAGIPVNSINPDRFQMFRRGEELAIRVESSGNVVTKIHFYAKKNDGVGDAELYEVPTNQPHQYYSLFTETATYFLTWKLFGTGKRMTFDGDLTPATQESYHWEEDFRIEFANYESGEKYGSGNILSSGQYALGEGWTGAAKGKTGVFTYTFDLTDQNNSVGALPQLELLLAGRNNLDHRMEVSINGSIEDTISGFTGKEYILHSMSIDWGLVASNQIVVSLKVLGYPSTSDQLSISYIRLKYPQNLSLGAGENKLFQLRESAGGSLYVGLTTSESGAAIYDVTDPINPVIRGTQYSSGTLYFVADNPVQSRQIQAVTTETLVTSLTEAMLDPINPSGADYLIITHNDLRAPASDGLDQIQAYANYRSADYSVYIVEINDLFDQFNYGDPSPLAIKNYLRYALGVTSLKYVFLIGKGTTHNFNPYRPTSTASVHYIPTYGVPGSDALFAVGLSGMNGSTVPEIPTGRLNARTSEQVKNYLEKVKTMESLGYTELWRKNMIHLSGGTNTGELTIFRNAVNDFIDIAESDYLGGKSFNKSKETASDVEFINVVDIVNDGVGLITFFGHSSSQATDIEIGLANASNGYANTGKNPVIIQNGCNGGAIFGNALTFGENWLYAQDLGAIGVIAHSDFALSTNLRRYTNLIYEYGFGSDETFGSSLGEIMLLTQNEFFNAYGTSETVKSQVYGMLLEGDPAVKMFDAAAPDYETTDQDITASPINAQRILSTSPSFSLDIAIRNYGRTVDDSLTIKVDRTLADGSIVSYTKQFERPLYQDTVSFEIINDGANRNDGTNFFIITLDPDNATPELNEINNNAAFELYLPKGNTINLFPQEHGVTDQSTVEFIWQPANILEDERSYSFELDTTINFDSPYQFSTELSGSSLLRLTHNIMGLPDSTTVYWRTRFAEKKQDEDTSWVLTSFTYVADQASGWGQFQDDQVRQNSVTGLTYDESARRWEFQETTQAVFISTHGPNNELGYGYNDFQVRVNGIDIFSTDSPSFPKCATNTINAVVFDRETANPRPPQDLLGGNYSALSCGLEPRLICNFQSSEVAADYVDLMISNMEVDDWVVIFSLDSVKYSDWDTQLKTSLASVGISVDTINALVDGQPVIFVGKKGLAEGEAVMIVDNESGSPIKEQVLELDDNITGVYTSGVISLNVGPAKSWRTFGYKVQDLGTDDIFFRVRGIQNSGQQDELIYADKNQSVDLSGINADVYPNLNLSFEVFDNDNQLPPQLSHWAIDYVQVPEGILIPEDKSSIEIPEGGQFERGFKFVNISDQNFEDSLLLNARLINISGGDMATSDQLIAGPAAGDTALMAVSFSTLNYPGDNNLSVSVRANEAEQYDVNNTINLTRVLNVKEDMTNPVLDVTFDGIYILDGDIVSPAPRILIQFKDDNQFLIKEDTVGMDIWLKAPCASCDYERVNLSDSKISYTPASENNDFEIEYLPGPLEDGIYHLRIQGEDASGNESGTQPYEISFEVINESTVTHFYPYPNPFSTSTRFVFTLTGSEIPDQIKIQIMTISGRVVREITQDEIGPLRIGNNMTQYAWDGRDEFGDLLANGVYLYKVFVQQSGEKLKHRTTSADRAFKNGFGKMYLLR